MDKPNENLKDFWNTPVQELLQTLQATRAGLSSDEAERRLRSYGPNSLTRVSRFASLTGFGRLLANPLVLILLIASVVSVAVGDTVGGSIIISIVVFSVLLDFVLEFQAHHAVEALKKQVASTAEVLRDGSTSEVPVAELVPGDIIKLNAGDLVPADARLIDAKDLHVRESALTGEALPVDKAPSELSNRDSSLTAATNSVFMGTAVQTGIGSAVIVCTGSRTAFGAIANRLAKRAPETEFARGIRHFGILITRITFALVGFVLLINVVFHRGLLESFLFSIALAVGLTPELMPMIITVTLARGARRMTSKQVVVKQLAAIEDFGSLEILCTDKTGTLTEGEIELDRHVDVVGNSSDSVLQLVYLNSFFEAGIRSPLDDAILKRDPPDLGEFAKVDEIPFDFYRKRLSVVVMRSNVCQLVTKGEAESVFSVCKTVSTDGAIKPLDDALLAVAKDTYKKLSLDGYRVLGVAARVIQTQPSYSASDESDMTLMGFAAFLDPPKPGIRDALAGLKASKISLVILTGDNEFVTEKIARQVGLPADNVLTGDRVSQMDDAALAVQAERGTIFARMSPEQKNRVILALKARGHVVGFIGDGINDAPSLHTADVGISVVNGVDVAKEAAKIILLEKDLAVLNEGVLEGRRSFANIMKYVIMGTSSNFGNMFSMAAASLFLPFLPMLPTQILLNNLLYDLSQLTIPTDNVDPASLVRPRRWKIAFIQRFMLIVGPISSLYDFLTFGVLLYGFHAFHNSSLFHSGWFVESLITQTLVVFVIRTSANPLRSRPSWPLVASVLSVVLVAVVLPYTAIGALMNFTPLPPALLAALMLLALTYLVLVQAVNAWFYRRSQLA